MKIVWKRNGFRLQFQIVCAIDCGNVPLTEVERALVKDTVRAMPQRRGVRVKAVHCGEQFLELLCDMDPDYEVAKTVQTIKAETAFQVGQMRGGKEGGLWAPGYVFVTIGHPIDAADTARELQQRKGSRKAEA